MIEIPTLESASGEYARLTGRQAELNARLLEIQAEQRRLYGEIGAEQKRDNRRERVAALAAGIDYVPPAPVREDMAKLADEARLIADAIHEITIQIAEERRKASRAIVEKFIPENDRLARKFFEHIAAAAELHVKHGEMRRAFMRAGVEPAGLHDFGQEMFGAPGQRNNDVSYLLRAGVKRGYLGAADVPECYR